MDDARIEVQLDSVQIAIEDLGAKVERVDKVIRGNGMGIVTQVALLDRRVHSCEEFVLEFKSIRRWLALGIVALFGSLAWSALEWYIATKPV